MNEKQLTASLGGCRGLPRLGDELDVDVLRGGGEGDLQATDRLLHSLTEVDLGLVLRIKLSS